MPNIEKVFYDENRRVEVVYRLRTETLGPQIASDIMEAFYDVTGHYNSRSRDQAWRSVKKFVNYLCLIGFSESVRQIDVVSGFAEYLKNNGRLKKTNGTHYNIVRRLVSRIADESSQPAWFDQGLSFKSFTREADCIRDNPVSIEDLKKISSACKKEILKVKQKFLIRKLLIDESPAKATGFSERDLKNLKKLIELESREIWTQKQMVCSGYATLGGCGLRKLTACKELTMSSVLPIYLLIMVQTAANPLSLMEINLECITQNPLDPNSALLVWDKHRASKTQKISLIREGNYSVPNLIQLVVGMTAPIRHLASAADRELLFITRAGHKAKRLNTQSLHNCLKIFREEHQLSHFTFADIRRAVAELVYNKTGSVQEVSKLLQHRKEVTTHPYLRSRTAAEYRYEKLAGFQGQMLELAEKTNNENFKTVIGFDCSAPLTGTAIGSKKGEPCLEFLSCATCKNAVVPIDDAVSIARIIRAQEHLEKLGSASMFDHEARERFDKVYRPILNIIKSEIICRVPASTYKNAVKLKETIPDLPVMT
ncbi:UNVERIFIED_ORG: hypothetical protein J2Y94_000827 [Pseudomonas poae]